MEKMRTLIANEPLLYRETIADALRRSRPRMEVSIAGPDDLEAEVERLDPHLVVCSRNCAPSKDGKANWVSWMRLYPEGNNLAEVTTAGGRAMLVGVKFEDFLAVVDGTEFLRRGALEGGPAV